MIFSKKQIVVIFFVFCFVFFGGLPAFAGPIEDLKPGEWYEVPNSKLEDVSPYPGVRNIMAAWNGGAYDTKRERLIIWGGGHGDYWGNEFYVFDVNSLKWIKLNDPYLPAKDFGWGVGYNVYPDGSPASVHTYDGIEYIPYLDKFFTVGGSRWRDGNGTDVTALFDFDTLKWSIKSKFPAYFRVGLASAYDPKTKKVLVISSGSMYAYDPSLDKWTKVFSGSVSTGGVGALDPERRKFVWIGNGYAYIYDISDLGNVTMKKLNAVGDTEIENYLPGIDYDYNSKKLVAWNGGENVYVLDISVSPPRWTKVSPSLSNKVVPTSATKWGTYGRWRYIPSKGVFIGVNRTNENVYFYRLSDFKAGQNNNSQTTDNNSTGNNIVPEVTLEFTSDKNSLNAPGNITLSWNAKGADRCVASFGWQGEKPTSGLEIITINKSDAFGLTCQNSKFSKSLTLQISLNQQEAQNNQNQNNNNNQTSQQGQNQNNNQNGTNSFYIPDDTWVAVKLPGIGKAPFGEMKHMRLAYNSKNKRIYFLGGDFAGERFYASGRNEIYSYSIEQNKWYKEQGYCRNDGTYYPPGPDQVGWVYDSKRDLFWMLPGYTSPGSKNNCQDRDKMIGEIMAFDPNTKTWIFENRSLAGREFLSLRKFAQYDPKTDSIIRFAWTGSGPRVEIYNISQDKWTTKLYKSDARLGFDYTAMDLKRRVIYMVSPYEGKLMEYNMDDMSIRYISDLPIGAVSPENTYPVWDSNNEVLLWFVYGSKKPLRLFVYDPKLNSWEEKAINQPDGLVPRGNAFVYNPDLNVTLIIGGYEPANPYMYFYRYKSTKKDAQGQNDNNNTNGNINNAQNNNQNDNISDNNNTDKNNNQSNNTADDKKENENYQNSSVFYANPDNYENIVSNLKAGDILKLSSGEYKHGLHIVNLNGQKDKPIIIEGPKDKSAVFLGRSCCNTVQIENSSYVVIKNLTLDGKNIDGIDGVNSRGITKNITISGFVILNHGKSQGTNGISTKGPAFGWVIENNLIKNAGTGIYLGDSDGSAPFVGGVIKGNKILDSIGYNMQIKHQKDRPQNVNLDEFPKKTVIKNNLFSKNSNYSVGGMARPNLLVGHFPKQGKGKDDFYEIYQNTFYQNPSEFLFQGEGNIAFYNNLLVNNFGGAVSIQPHNDVPKNIYIFQNTIVSSGLPIRVVGADKNYEQKVFANAVFSDKYIAIDEDFGNFKKGYSEAEKYLKNPKGNLENLSLVPKEKLEFTPKKDFSGIYAMFENANVDFSGSKITSYNNAGAYFVQKDNQKQDKNTDTNKQNISDNNKEQKNKENENKKTDDKDNQKNDKNNKNDDKKAEDDTNNEKNDNKKIENNKQEDTKKDKKQTTKKEEDKKLKRRVQSIAISGGGGGFAYYSLNNSLQNKNKTEEKSSDQDDAKQEESGNKNKTQSENIAKNQNAPETTLPFGLKDGDIISGPDRVKVYIVNKYGYKRHIFNPKVFDMYGHLKWENIKYVSEDVLNFFETSSFYRTEGQSKVFFLKKNGDSAEKRWVNVSGEDFVKLGFDFKQVFLINKQEENYYKEGEPISYQEMYNIKNNIFPTGTLIKKAGKDDIYVVLKTKKMKIPNPYLFKEWGFKWSDVKLVKDDVFNKYGILKYPESGLIRAENDKKIYKIKGTKKIWIPTVSEFLRLGYEPNSEVVVTKEFADEFEETS